MTEKKIARIEKALHSLSSHMEECRLCPRSCGVNRRLNADGFCRTGNKAVLSHALLHFGEEPVISGVHDCISASKKAQRRLGSGTIFFTGCNLRCVYCQNYQISWERQGNIVESDNLAEMMLGLQKKGALNINFVSPTPHLIPILEALKKAVNTGLNIPLVYNTSGYERLEIIRCIDGIFDIYLPDLKYASPSTASLLSSAPDYFEYAAPAVIEMVRQQPETILNKDGSACRGTIIRHLILPGSVENSLSIIDWIRNNLTGSFCLSLMSQFHPSHKTPPSMRRRISHGEYEQVVDYVQEIDFDTLFIQPETFSGGKHRLPDFNFDDPFSWD